MADHLAIAPRAAGGPGLATNGRRGEDGQRDLFLAHLEAPDAGHHELVSAGDGASNVKFVGVTASRGELLRSPVSGTPCVHWRLRIVEQMNPTLQLVHEISSDEEFDLIWSGTGGHSQRFAGTGALTDAVKMRLLPQSARIQATPVLHRAGSPGALATSRQFGFVGDLSVEEVTLRAGETIEAEGLLEPWSGANDGPFRGVSRELELFDATVRLPTRVALAPVLLPWALGTAAALLGGVGVAAWAARRFDLLPAFDPTTVPGALSPSTEIGPLRYVRKHFSRPE